MYLSIQLRCQLTVQPACGLDSVTAILHKHWLYLCIGNICMSFNLAELGPWFTFMIWWYHPSKIGTQIRVSAELTFLKLFDCRTWNRNSVLKWMNPSWVQHFGHEEDQVSSQPSSRAIKLNYVKVIKKTYKYLVQTSTYRIYLTHYSLKAECECSCEVTRSYYLQTMTVCKNRTDDYLIRVGKCNTLMTW